MNAYASTAIQAKGRIWGEVSLQIGYAIAIVAGVGLGSRWGVSGAAGGALAATVVMGVLMHALLLRVAQFGWRDLVEPQLPAAACVAGLVAVLLGLPALCRAQLAIPLEAPWQLLAVRAGGGGLFYLAFIRFCSFTAVRSLVRETASELPPWLTRWAPVRTLVG
jgi:hypothetical protein